MKRSLKWIAGICASVLLLSCVLTCAVSAAVVPTTPGYTTSYWDYMFTMISNRTLLPDGTYRLPNGQIMTQDEINSFYQNYYLYQYGGSNFYPTYPGATPGYTSVLTSEITLEQFQMSTLPYGPSYTYISTNTKVASVDAYGRVFGVAPGTAYITVSNASYTFAVITVNVTAAPAGSVSNLSVVANVENSYIAPGTTTKLYAYVTIGGYPTNSSLYTLEYEISDENVISLDAASGTILALAEGSASITVTISGTDISQTVSVFVTKTGIPSLPNWWYPGINDGTDNPNGWIVSIPGQGIVDTFYPGYYPNYWGNLGGNGNFGNISGIDTSKYDIEYHIIYIDGSYRQVIVLVPKEEVEDEKPATPVVPEKPTLTPEELEEIKKQEEEAARLAALEAQIAKARKGEITWFEVYNDINSSSVYAAGVNFVLNNEFMAGNTDGSFGAKEVMTYADIAELFTAYLGISAEEFEKLGILAGTEAEAVVSHEQAALAFYNLAKHLKVSTAKTADLGKYTDADKASAEYKEALSWAVANYVVSTTSKKLGADTVTIKSTLAQMMYRFDKLVK